MSKEENLIKEVTVELSTEKGPVSVPAIMHVNCNGLVVAMSAFGSFSVTHTETGLKLTDYYERATSALLVLSQFALIAKEHGFSWELGTKGELTKVIARIKGSPVPFDLPGFKDSVANPKMTIREWMRNLRMMNFGGFVDEFPWEEDNRCDDAMANLAACKPEACPEE